jgi:hypothetical protein
MSLFIKSWDFEASKPPKKSTNLLALYNPLGNLLNPSIRNIASQEKSDVFFAGCAQLHHL